MSILVFVVILSVLVIVHEFGHFIFAKKIGVRVEVFSLGFGRKLLSLKRNGTEYTLSLIPLGGYVKLAGDNREEFKGRPDEFLSRKIYERAAICFFGPLLNYLLAFLCFVLVFYIGSPTLTTKVGELMPGYPAKKAGILVGDKILAVDGKKIFYLDDLQEAIHKKKEGTVKLLISRDNKEFDLTLNTRSENINDITGQKHTVGLIGIKPADDIVVVKYGILDSIVSGWKRLIMLTSITYQAIWRMITGTLSLKESITGPIGIFYITSEVAKLGIVAILHLVAALNVSLAIFNLLPFPILDGGHLTLLVIEKVRGRSLEQKIEETINRVAISLLIVFAVFIFYNDLIKFGIFEKVSKYFH